VVGVNSQRPVEAVLRGAGGAGPGRRGRRSTSRARG
jgi:hypothetical protein